MIQFLEMSSIKPHQLAKIMRRAEKDITDLSRQAARLAARRLGGQRYETRVGPASLGKDDLLPGMGLLQQTREMRLGFMDVDDHGHRIHTPGGLSHTTKSIVTVPADQLKLGRK